MSDTKTMVVATSVVCYGPEILLLKRTNERRYSPGQWEFVSGFVKGEEFRQVESCIPREVMEETGLEGRIIGHGNPVMAQHDGVRWVVLPYKFESSSKDVKISKEHTEYQWINPSQLSNYDCVDKAAETLEAVGIKAG